MTRRYYVPDLPLEGGFVELPTLEASHANKVMRQKVGDQIELFNGAGIQGNATIVSQGRNQCAAECEIPSQVNREPLAKITMGVALPKADRAKKLVERLTEMGVSRMVPLSAEYTQATKAKVAIDKLERIVIEACKQSGRNLLMEISKPQRAVEFFCADRLGRKWIADPRGDQIRPIPKESGRQELTIAIGPEGGFSEQENDLAMDNGFQRITLGPRIYRIETAAITMAALMIHQPRENAE